jgi:hypothetical protein
MTLSLGASVHIGIVMGVQSRSQRRHARPVRGAVKAFSQSIRMRVVQPNQSTLRIRLATHDGEEEARVGED